MIKIIIILAIPTVILIGFVYVNEKLIVKLPSESKIKKFWKKHICDEFDN